VTFGQELAAWRTQVEKGIERITAVEARLFQLAQGGTAVGTGINAHPGFSARFAQELSQATGIDFKPNSSLFEGIATQDTAVELSGQLKTVAVSLMKIANDLRWMNSGPLAGLGEIALPALQPGSSIMPGKVNPVIPEATTMVAAEVIGNDASITIAGQSGNFQLNVMLPLVGYKLLESIRLLANVSRALADAAIAGFTVNQSRLQEALERNPILVTALNPVIGYEKGAAIAKKAYAEGKPILEVAAKNTDLPVEQLKSLLDPAELTKGGIKGGTSGGG
jgi:fumarate hydratase class II